MALHYTNGHLVLIEQVDLLKSMLGRVCVNTKRKVELILKLLIFIYYQYAFICLAVVLLEGQ